MSSDVSSQSQDANKHNRSSHTSTSIHSTPSSSDPISVWGSRRSSEVSSIERLSPSNSMRLTSLRSELPVIEDTKDLSNIPSIPSNCDTNGNSPYAEKLQGSPPDYFQATASMSTGSFTNRSNFNLLTGQALNTNETNRLTPIPQSPQLFQNHDCENQNIEWNSNEIIENDTHLDKCEQDLAVALDSNKDILLPDDVVDYLNEVTKQEVQENMSCFQNQNSYSTQIKTDSCNMCKHDSHNSKTFQNSCCNQAVLPPVKSFYQNCAIPHHLNFSSSNCLSQDINHFNHMDTQNNYNQNQNNFHPVITNGCKNEFAPQSCNQIASQHMMNGCNQQQPWNNPSASTNASFQNQMCPSHNINPSAMYCNQQHYVNPPPPYQVPNQYASNNHQMLDNRCHVANCGSSQSMHVPQMFCSHTQVHQMQTQQPLQSVYQCSGAVCADVSNNLQSNFQQMNQSYGSYHQQGNQMHNHNHFPQYHQCSNCGAGQTFSSNHCYMNSTIQQSNAHQQFIPPSHNAQCNTQHSAQTVIGNNTVDDMRSQQLSKALSPINTLEKPIISNNQTYNLPKTENSYLHSACGNNSHSTSSITGVNSTMSIVHNTFENNNQNVDVTSNVVPPSAQSILPTGNMVINDMNSILTSLMEETKYLKLLQ